MLVCLLDLEDDLHPRKESLGSLALEIRPSLIDQPVVSGLKWFLGQVQIRRSTMQAANKGSG